jgi:deazaflavin-dependent oxidoreductase (nitroreductase family)
MFSNSMRRVSKYVISPLVRGFAGKYLLAMIWHTGRRSGRTYATPIIVRKAGDTFFIALTYGPTTDWCRNVLAAGKCTIELRGRRYRAVEPRIVGRAAALGHFNLLEQALLRIGGVEQYLLLRDAS